MIRARFAPTPNSFPRVATPISVDSASWARVDVWSAEEIPGIVRRPSRVAEIDSRRCIMQDTESPAYPDTQEAAETRARIIRARLPGQMLRERIETAALVFGPLYSLQEIYTRVGETLPRRIGYVRSAVTEPIETYRARIPNEVLLRYDDAVQSGLFGKFMVVTPTYYRDRQLDPWIIAEVTGSDRWAIIARWDE
jgi:hypothetical protein